MIPEVLHGVQYPEAHTNQFQKKKKRKKVVSYHSPLTKSPIQPPYPSAPIHKDHGKLITQAQDTHIAQ